MQQPDEDLRRGIEHTNRPSGRKARKETLEVSEEERGMACAECQAECDDFHFDEYGELVIHCPDCPYGGGV